MTIAVALGAGLLIGLSLGALGGGGSVLAVPLLVYGLGQSAGQATTGSLVVVAVTSVLAAVTSASQGRVRWGHGVLFGLASVAGAALGSVGASRMPDAVLMTAFAVLLIVVAAVMVRGQVRGKDPSTQPAEEASPIVQVHPRWSIDGRRLATLVVAASVVGLLTGFLGVGGGFLVVPALVLVLGLRMDLAAGTSLVVITIASVAALVVRAGVVTQPDWAIVGWLTLAAALGGQGGALLAGRLPVAHLQRGFVALLVLVAGYTSWQAIPDLLS